MTAVSASKVAVTSTGSRRRSPASTGSMAECPLAIYRAPLGSTATVACCDRLEQGVVDGGVIMGSLHFRGEEPRQHDGAQPRAPHIVLEGVMRISYDEDLKGRA